MLNLTNKTAKEKAQLKSMELAKVKLSKFTKGGFDIEIIGDIKQVEVNGCNGIELFATAYKNGKQCGFGKDGSVEIERFRFFNPPVLVDDENGDIIREREEENIETGIKEIKQRKLKYDPEEAIKQDLVHTVSVIAKDNKNIIKGKIGNTASTFYPAAGENSPVDGYVQRGDWEDHSEAFSTVRTSAGTLSGDTDAILNTWVSIACSTVSNEFRFIRRGIILFDTSALSGEQVDSAILSTYCYNKGVANGAPSLDIVSSNPASNSSLANSDYDYNDFGTTVFATKTISSIGTSGYNNFSLNSSGKLNISTTGISKFGMRINWDTTGSFGGSWTSNGQFYYSGYAADETGTAKDPKLVVQHSDAPAGPANLKSINGLAKASIKSRNGLAIASIKSINGLS